MHFNKGKAYGRQGKAPTRLIFAEALLLIMLNGVRKLSSVSTTNVCRRDGDVRSYKCKRI